MSNEEFRSLLTTYFRNGCLDRSDKLLSVLSPSVPFQKNAKKIQAAFKETKSVSKDLNKIVFEIENYSGNNIYAKKISEFLKNKTADGLIGVYTHSSVAISEEVLYSDFDGFVILKDQTLLDAKRVKKVAWTLKQSEKIMSEMDPLQHHGWFILTESDLKNFPEYYFPNELIRYSKCLFGENKIAIQISKEGFKEQFNKSFNNMARGILNKLDSKSFLNNYYNFKNLLSEFMLLPAFYIQAKTGFGIFKKFSFEKVKNELGEKYAVMDEISSVRSNWNYRPSAIYCSLKSTSNLFSRMIPSKYFSGNLPSSLKNKFDDEFIQKMKNFVRDLKLRLPNEPTVN